MQNFILRIGTFNIRNTTDHYEKRLPLLQNTLKEMNVDIVGLQEVSFNEKNQLKDIDPEDQYIPLIAETQMNYRRTNEIKDEFFNIDGNAFLMKKEVYNKSENIRHLVLHLSPIRCAHMLSFELNGLNISIVNLHLHHVIEEEVIRLYQIKTLLKWIEFNTEKDSLNIIVGDFNAMPLSETYNTILDYGYLSSHSHFHKEEPIKTFHNKMDAPYKDDSDDGTFDYIFIRKNNENLSNFKYQIENVTIHGTEECEVNKGIFASDHFAMVIQLNIN